MESNKQSIRQSSLGARVLFMSLLHDHVADISYGYQVCTTDAIFGEESTGHFSLDANDFIVRWSYDFESVPLTLSQWWIDYSHKIWAAGTPLGEYSGSGDVIVI